MKIGITLLLLLLLITGIVLFFTQSTNNNADVEIGEAEDITTPNTMKSEVNAGEYTVIPDESTIGWTANKPQILGYTHNGTMSIKEGSLSLTEDTLTGQLIIDMTKLKLLSLGGGKAGNESRLETHLKSGDFFEVETYPEATFVIRESTKNESDGTYTVVGDLTIKDTTHEVSFPATVIATDSNVTLTGELTIDRTKWGITFGSASFFDNLADNAINDEVELSLTIVATAR